MKSLKTFLESILVDDPDMDLGALAASTINKWGSTNLGIPEFNWTGDVLELDCSNCYHFQIWDLDYLCSTGVRKLKFINAPSVQLTNVSSIKNMSIELVGGGDSLFIEQCSSLTIENSSLKAKFIHFGERPGRSFDCKLHKTDIVCDYIRLKGLAKLSMSGCSIQADGLYVSHLRDGNFMSKISKIDIGLFASKPNKKSWRSTFDTFPSADKEIELLEVDIERLLNIKNNKLNKLKKIVIADMDDYGLVFFKRGLCALPLSFTSGCADCAGPWEVAVTRAGEREVVIQYN